MLKTIIAFFIIFFIIYKAGAKEQEYIVGHPEPLPNELLSEPIVFKNCHGLKIIEWRGSKNKPETSPNKKSIEIINKLCKISLDIFISFLKSKNLSISGDFKYLDNYTISLIPWDAFDSGSWDGVPGNGPGDGDDYRNLQDSKYRFKDRMKFYDNQGNIMELLGFTDRNIKSIYIRNDVLSNNNEINLKFAEVFCHELFHAMSNSFGIYDNLGKNASERQGKDEILAKEFTKFLGL